MLSTLLLNFLLLQAKVHAHPLGPNAIPENDPYSNAANISSRAEPYTQASSSQLGTHVASSSSERQVHIANGRKILQAMESSTGEQSKYTNWDDLRSWGWEEYPEIGEECDLDKFELPLQMYGDLGISPVESNWKHIELEHAYGMSRDGKEYGATNGIYDTWINAKDGVILTGNVWGPRAMNEDNVQDGYPDAKNLPELEHWSDVLFLVWDKYAKGHEIKHVLVVDIYNKRTKGAIVATPESLDSSSGTEAFPHDWPAIAYNPRLDSGLVLLDTPIAKGVARFLIEHKQQLGVRRIDSIRPFSTFKEDQSEVNIYFRIAPVSLSSRKAARSEIASANGIQSEAFSHNLDVHNGTSVLERRFPPTMVDPALDPVVAVAQQRGSQLVEYMLGDIEEFDEEHGQFKDSAFAQSGWLTQVTPVAGQDLQSYRSILNGLTTVSDTKTGQWKLGIPTFLWRNKRTNQDPVNLANPVRVSWEQRLEYTPECTIYGTQTPTKGIYVTIYDVQSRVMIIEEASSPAAQMPNRDEDELPELRDWSDIAFLELARQYSVDPLKGRHGELRPPRWVLHSAISSPMRSLELISYCLRRAGTQHVLPWPGTTFQLGTRCFDGLLGTEMGEQLSLFLITHRERFGPQGGVVLASVTIFLRAGDVQDKSGIEQPSLLWNIMSNRGETIDTFNANKEADNDNAYLPYLLIPMIKFPQFREANILGNVEWADPRLFGPARAKALARLKNPQYDGSRPIQQVPQAPRPAVKGGVTSGPSGTQRPWTHEQLQAQNAQQAYTRLRGQGFSRDAAFQALVNAAMPLHPEMSPTQLRNLINNQLRYPLPNQPA